MATVVEGLEQPVKLDRTPPQKEAPVIRSKDTTKGRWVCGSLSRVWC